MGEEGPVTIISLTVIAHACFLTAILARLFGNLTGESGADSSFG
jgi:hypothetical protein